MLPATIVPAKVPLPISLVLGLLYLIVMLAVAAALIAAILFAIGMIGVVGGAPAALLAKKHDTIGVAVLGSYVGAILGSVAIFYFGKEFFSGVHFILPMWGLPIYLPADIGLYAAGGSLIFSVIYAIVAKF